MKPTKTDAATVASVQRLRSKNTQRALVRGRLQLRGRLQRGLRLRLSLFAYVLRRIGPTLLAVAAYMAAAAWVVRWDLARAGDEVPDLQEALFSMFMLLSFEPSTAFPRAALARAVFWLTPLVGVFLIAEGLLKVGVSLIDPAARREVWMTIVTDAMRGHVVVCGLGHVGYRVVQELSRLGEEIVALEQAEGSPFVAQARAEGIPVHVGDARRDDLLEKVGIARAKAVVCATDDDLANLEIALDAKRMNPRIRVVMRMFDQRLAGKVGGALELDESFSTSAMAAPLIAMQATQEGVRSAYRLGDMVRVTAEITTDAAVGGRSVHELEARGPFRVVSLRRGDGDFRSVRGSDVVRPGDVVIIDTAAADLPAARRHLGGPGASELDRAARPVARAQQRE